MARRKTQATPCPTQRNLVLVKACLTLTSPSSFPFLPSPVLFCPCCTPRRQVHRQGPHLTSSHFSVVDGNDMNRYGQSHIFCSFHHSHAVLLQRLFWVKRRLSLVGQHRDSQLALGRIGREMASVSIWADRDQSNNPHEHIQKAPI